MNLYIERNIHLLPLLEFCSGEGTQEDGIIDYILSRLGNYTPFAVEFGQRTLGGGTLGKTARCRQFPLLNMDVEACTEEQRTFPWGDEKTWTLLKCKISPLNINAIFDENDVPANPAVVVVDVDGMDYWCTLALLQRRRPALLIVEYNCNISPEISTSLAFNPEHSYQKNKNYGSSLRAFINLASFYGYRFIHIHGPMNLYFVHEKALLTPDIFSFADKLSCLSPEEFTTIAHTGLFYDSFHGGSRPSWFHTPNPNPQNPPWLPLDRIGDSTQIVKIDEISLEVFTADKGGDHYKQRGHKEDSVSPLWRLIREKLKPLSLIDVGANYGYTTCLLANRLGVQNAIAVEPDPRLSRILKKNLNNNMNGINFRVVEASVSSNPDQITSIGLNPASSQDNRLVAQKNWQMAVVPTISLDSLIANIDPETPLFIKCDTQGFDMDVIKSGFNRLRNLRNWMLRCEYGPYWIENQGFNPIQNLEWLCGAFRVFESPLRTSWKQSFEDVFHNPLVEEDAAPFCEYVRKLNHNGMGWLDLFLLPK